MFLYEYIVKLLMGNSNNLFLGLIIVLIGYYGWLLWNINNKNESYLKKWERFSEKSDDMEDILKDIEKMIYRENTQKLNTIVAELDNLKEKSEDISEEIERTQDKMLDNLNQEIEELKQTMSILLKCYRNISGESLKELNSELSKNLNIEDENSNQKNKYTERNYIDKNKEDDNHK